jgi:hypothetical protein
LGPRNLVTFGFGASTPLNPKLTSKYTPLDSSKVVTGIWPPLTPRPSDRPIDLRDRGSLSGLSVKVGITEIREVNDFTLVLFINLPLA